MYCKAGYFLKSYAPENARVLRELHEGRLGVLLKCFKGLAEGRYCFYLLIFEEEEKACCLRNLFTFVGVWQPANLLFLASTASIGI